MSDNINRYQGFLIFNELTWRLFTREGAIGKGDHSHLICIDKKKTQIPANGTAPLSSAHNLLLPLWTLSEEPA